MPFAGYKDFDACTQANQDKDDPDAYCGKIKSETEDKLDGPSEVPDRKLTLAIGSASIATTEALLALHDTPGSPHREHMQGGGQQEGRPSTIQSVPLSDSAFRSIAREIEPGEEVRISWVGDKGKTFTATGQVTESRGHHGFKMNFDESNEPPTQRGTQDVAVAPGHMNVVSVDRVSAETKPGGPSDDAGDDAGDDDWGSLPSTDPETAQQEWGSLPGGGYAHGGGPEAGDEFGDEPSDQRSETTPSADRPGHSPNEAFTGWAGWQPLRESVGKATIATVGALLALHDTPDSPHSEHDPRAGQGDDEDAVEHVIPEEDIADIKDRLRVYNGAKDALATGLENAQNLASMTHSMEGDDLDVGLDEVRANLEELDLEALADVFPGEARRIEAYTDRMYRDIIGPGAGGNPHQSGSLESLRELIGTDEQGLIGSQMEAYTIPMIQDLLGPAYGGNPNQSGSLESLRQGDSGGEDDPFGEGAFDPEDEMINPDPDIYPEEKASRMALHDTPNSPHREHARGGGGGGQMPPASTPDDYNGGPDENQINQLVGELEIGHMDINDQAQIIAQHAGIDPRSQETEEIYQVLQRRSNRREGAKAGAKRRRTGRGPQYTQYD